MVMKHYWTDNNIKLVWIDFDEIRKLDKRILLGLYICVVWSVLDELWFDKSWEDKKRYLQLLNSFSFKQDIDE